jgi:hypothetical protein
MEFIRSAEFSGIANLPIGAVAVSPEGAQSAAADCARRRNFSTPCQPFTSRLSPIYFAAMTNFYDFDDSFTVVHGVEDSVVTLADTVDVFSK